MIPYEDRYTLVGTTDVPVEGDPAAGAASPEEVEYLCRAVNRYLARTLAPSDVLWRYAGVRPLYDDGSVDPSAVTRDYTLRVDAGRRRGAGAVGLRRQDHDLPKARRAGVGEAARRTFRGMKPARGPRARRSRAAISAASERGARRAPRPLPPIARPRWWTDLPAPRHACAGGGRRRHPGRGFRRRPHRARAALFRRARMGAHRRGCAVAAHQGRAADDAPARRVAQMLGGR